MKILKILLVIIIASFLTLLIGGIMFIINPIWVINIIMNSVLVRILLVAAFFGAFLSYSEN